MQDKQHSRHVWLVMAIVLALTSCVDSSAFADGRRKRIELLRQITHITTGDIQEPRIRLEGGQITFVATADVLGPGTEHTNREVYLYDDLVGSIVRVTNSGAGESYAVTRSTDDTNSASRPRMVALVSTGDLDPVRDNSDGNPEIFIWNINANIFYQMTDTVAPVVNSDPFLSDGGLCLVFSSTGDIADNDGSDPDNLGLGFSNADASQEVFLYSRLDGEDARFPYTGNFTQISNGPAGSTSSHPVIGGYWYPRQCQWTVYQSSQDLESVGFAGQHIYLYERPSARLTMMSSREIPFGVPLGTYQNPFISSASQFARGPFVVFETDADLWRNESTGSNVFRYRSFHPQLMQYTDVQGGLTQRPVISDGGGLIAMQSSAELLRPRRSHDGIDPPFNADGNFEIFRWKGRRKVQQITVTENCENGQPALRDDGRSLAFRSTCDLIPGHNPNGLPQIFVWQTVKLDHVLAQPGACEQVDGCCLAGSSCYDPIDGRQRDKPPRPNCVDKLKGCRR